MLSTAKLTSARPSGLALIKVSEMLNVASINSPLSLFISPEQLSTQMNTEED